MERFVALRKGSREAYLLSEETLDEAFSKLQGYADYLEIYGRILESLVYDYRRDDSVDGLEEIAERMVENSVRFATLLGSTLEFERLMKAYGLETKQEQGITGDDETMP